jgi:putative acetyltransferase
MLQVRKALPEDIEIISRLFRKTIKTVNSKDYDPHQLQVWSARYRDLDWWKDRVRTDCFLVAVKDSRVLGFCSVNSSGVLELMYVHMGHQGTGVGTALMKAIEDYSSGCHIREIVSEVSITAKPFFEKMGFTGVRRNHREIEGVKLTNYIMRKKVSSSGSF